MADILPEDDSNEKWRLVGAMVSFTGVSRGYVLVPRISNLLFSQPGVDLHGDCLSHANQGSHDMT